MTDKRTEPLSLTSRWPLRPVPSGVVELRADEGERRQRDEATSRALAAYLQLTRSDAVTLTIRL